MWDDGHGDGRLSLRRIAARLHPSTGGRSLAKHLILDGSQQMVPPAVESAYITPALERLLQLTALRNGRNTCLQLAAPIWTTISQGTNAVSCFASERGSVISFDIMSLWLGSNGITLVNSAFVVAWRVHRFEDTLEMFWMLANIYCT